jgi:endonuclease/exonuclease/phosphatase family metal-dependent hydrolase
MKLITLNVWGGRILEPLKAFLKKHDEVDMWCFQEVYHEAPDVQVKVPEYEPNLNLLNEIKSQLNSHNSEFCQVLDNFYGITSFIHKDIKIQERGEMLVARGGWFDPTDDLHNRDHHRKLQWIELNIKGKKMILANVHLTHRPEGKADSEKRLNQSRIILDFLKMFDCPKILCGDFNLLPETESIRMIENAGMINLVKKFNIPSTRTELYKKPLKFADYIFVSPEIKVNDFKVLPDVVSDHAPLYLDFEI